MTKLTHHVGNISINTPIKGSKFIEEKASINDIFSHNTVVVVGSRIYRLINCNSFDARMECIENSQVRMRRETVVHLLCAIN